MLSANAVPVPTSAPAYQPIVPPMNAARVLSIIDRETLGAARRFTETAANDHSSVWHVSLQMTTAPQRRWKYSAG